MDKGLLRELYQRYERELYLYLFSLCGNRSLAEDLLQETFLKALLSLSDAHTNMRAWLYMVARNLYYNYYRREKNSLPMEKLPDRQEEEAFGTADEVLEKLISEERRRKLYQALDTLDGKKREVLEMQYFGGLSQKEIAAVLHLTPENVRVSAYRAKRELKAYMEENDYDLS